MPLMADEKLFDLFDKVGLVGEQILSVPMGTYLQIRIAIAKKKTKVIS